MSESERVQRWREAKRNSGRKALTIWITAERELRAKDLATQWPSSLSEIFEQALDQFQPIQAQRISNVTDIEQIRQLIKDEVAASLAMQTAVTATVADTVTDTMLEEDAPVVDTGILGAVTATNSGNVADTQPILEAEPPAPAPGSGYGAGIAAVRAAALERQVFSCAELAAALGRSGKAVHQDLHKLVKDGLL